MSASNTNENRQIEETRGRREQILRRVAESDAHRRLNANKYAEAARRLQRVPASGGKRKIRRTKKRTPNNTKRRKRGGDPDTGYITSAGQTLRDMYGSPGQRARRITPRHRVGGAVPSTAPTAPAPAPAQAPAPAEQTNENSVREERIAQRLNDQRNRENLAAPAPLQSTSGGKRKNRRTKKRKSNNSKRRSKMRSKKKTQKSARTATFRKNNKHIQHCGMR